MNITTIHNINSIFSDIASRHYQINTYLWAQDWEIDSGENIYSALIVNPNSADLIRSEGNDRYTTMEITLNVKVLDLVSKDESNEVDVVSDTLQILTDVINEFNDHEYYQNSNMKIVDDISFLPLDEYTDDGLSGWECDMAIRMINYNNGCGIPADAPTGDEFPE